MGLFGDFLQSAGGSILGSSVSGLFNNHSANKQMAFQRDMSGSAHQREVADLRAAGLNPVLSATGGGGASTPSGAMAQLQPPDIIGNTARLSEVKRENEVRAAQKKLLEEQTNATLVSRWLNAHLINKAQAETAAINAQSLIPRLKADYIMDSPKLMNMIKTEGVTDSIGRHGSSASHILDFLKGIF